MAEINETTNESKYFKVELMEEGKEVGHGFLFLIRNEGHDNPYGLLERIFVSDDQRGKGYGTVIVNKLLEIARRENCYKVLGTSRHSNPDAHRFYEKLGFKNHGAAFRLDLIDEESSI